MHLPPTLPRALDGEAFRAEPLGYLRERRVELGDAFVLREEGPILSRTPDCNGVVAVFGTERQRAVLGDIETFGMPPSAARQLGLDASLTNLNRSLHSMRGEEHAAQKRVLTSVLDGARFGDLHEVLERSWRPASTFPLFAAMRALTLPLASHVLFGEGGGQLTELLQLYFQLRREAASPAGAAGKGTREMLVETGEALDEALRRFLRTARADSLLGRLAGVGLSEDEVVGHANIVFVSSTEPIAVALTWTLLILSQLPELRRELREELAAGGTTLLDCVLRESLRVLPPNAFMVRLTTRPVSLCGTDLPERCEVILSPFVAHRDATRFPDPDIFRPSRWLHARPSPFDYFPFGAGGHACVGRGVALQLMKSVLAFLMTRHELVLDGDQEIDWRIHIQFLPHDDPLMRLLSNGVDGKLRGRVAALLDFSRRADL